MGLKIPPQYQRVYLQKLIEITYEDLPKNQYANQLSYILQIKSSAARKILYGTRGIYERRNHHIDPKLKQLSEAFSVPIEFLIAEEIKFRIKISEIYPGILPK